MMIREGLSQKLTCLIEQAKPLIVLRGAKGVGKFSLAKETARFALSDGRGELCCFQPAEGKSYLLEQIKEIVEIAKAQSLMGEKKVLLLDDFVDLSPPLLNSLLKLFEEPPEGVSFILVVHDGRALLPTIASRALHLHVGLLSDQVLLDCAAEKGWITEKDSPQAKDLLAFAQGQMYWAEKFTGQEFVERRKPLYDQISQLVFNYRSSVSSQEKAASIWETLSLLDEFDKKQVFEELVRYLMMQLQSRFLVTQDGNYWGYLRLCLHLNHRAEAVARGESMASSLYSISLETGTFLENHDNESSCVKA